MAQDKTIGELAELSALTGAEMIPVETANGNNKITTNAIKTFAKPKEWVLKVDMSNASVLGENIIRTTAAESKRSDDVIANFNDVSVGDKIGFDNGEGGVTPFGIITGKGLAGVSDGSVLITAQGVFSEQTQASLVVNRYNKTTDNYRCTVILDAKSIEILVNQFFFGIATETYNSAELTLVPNRIINVGEQKSLTITLAEYNSWDNDFELDFTPEYMLEFISGETPTNLTLPADVKFPEEPTIEANKRYQLSIVNNIALLVGVDL